LLNANIGFSDSGYVIKPLQPSSTICGASPFTGHLKKLGETGPTHSNVQAVNIMKTQGVMMNGKPTTIGMVLVELKHNRYANRSTLLE